VKRALAPAVFGLLALASCGGGGQPASLGQAASSFVPQRPAAALTDARKKKPKIQHVVVIVQENRSFDNLFQAYPGADTVSIGKNSQGQSITLQPIPLEAPYGINHSSVEHFQACDGSGSIPGTNCRMDGFDKEITYGEKIPANAQYGYVPHSETTLYFDMAQQYVLADHMFTSHIDASFVSHQYLIAGQANGAVDLPTTLWGCGGGASDTVKTLTQQRTYGPAEGVCFTYPTIADELNEKNLPWRYYAPPSTDPSYVWSGYQAISDIYNSPQWTANVISPPQQFITDVQSGTLGAVTWIAPYCQNSDHASCISNSGPQWVASLVNAIGQSPYWDTTTIFVMWDEWGGWYDHEPPPYVDYDGLGFRVPLIIISPYAKQGYVTKKQYEHGSILKYIEDTFGLKRLAASDKRANSPTGDAIDYSQQPRAFTPFTTDMKLRDFVHEPPDPRPPDNE
jgi:phospholipase C